MAGPPNRIDAPAEPYYGRPGRTAQITIASRRRTKVNEVVGVFGPRARDLTVDDQVSPFCAKWKAFELRVLIAPQTLRRSANCRWTQWPQ
jgi:hypothetical protein